MKPIVYEMNMMGGRRSKVRGYPIPYVSTASGKLQWGVKNEQGEFLGEIDPRSVTVAEGMAVKFPKDSQDPNKISEEFVNRIKEVVAAKEAKGAPSAKNIEKVLLALEELQ